MAITSRSFYSGIARNVERSGRHLMGVFDSPPFTYSIGNSLRNLPELLMIGLHPNDAAMLINHLSALMIERGREFSERELVDIGGKFPTMAVHCAPGIKQTHTIQAGQYLGHEDYRVTQMVVPDPNGHFPGDPLCMPPYSLVPVYGRPLQ